MKLINCLIIKLYLLLIFLLTQLAGRKKFKNSPGNKGENINEFKNNEMKKQFTLFKNFLEALKRLKESINSSKNKFLLKNREFLQSNNSFSLYYDHFFNLSHSNTNNLETSQPFSNILTNVLNFFPSEKNKTFADQEIQRLRSLQIDAVTNFFVKYNITNTSEYWYVYYLLSNVALKGQINSQGSAKAWKAPEPKKNEVFKDFIDDKFFHYLKKKEKDISYEIEKCKNRTIYEVKKLEEQQLLKSGNNKDKALKERSPKDLYRLSLNDFYLEQRFLNYIFKTKFYKTISLNFPKGIIHHIHLSAIASKNEFQEIFLNMFGGEYKLFENRKIYEQRKHIDDSTNNQTIVFVKAHEEDRFKKGSFYEMNFSKLYYIKDFFKTAETAKTNNYENLFKENYIINNRTCSVDPITNKTLFIDIEVVAYFYLKFCEDNTIFTRNQIMIEEIKNLNNNSTQIKPIQDINEMLKYSGGVLDFHNIVMNNGNFLPKSYFNLLFNIKDLLSNGIWFKFESVFGFYDNLFNNPNMISDLLKIVVRKFKNMKIAGIEFRQKNDIDKEFSKVRAIREEFSKQGIETAFILPGRKTRSGNKFEDIIKGITNTKGAVDISGIDFLGYEDDPFTGARNFFPVVLERVLDPSRKSSKKPSNFEILFETLQSGKSLYLHAGETRYFPNYPIEEKFMKKFYINDNLFHSALLPNVKRVGHGFAVANNDLLMNIFKKKKIHLEICPISNQLLHYWDAQSNPFLRLLRQGLSVSISSDDPGFFGYTGVSVDWFTVINQTRIKPSELYMLLKYSVLKASPNIAAKKNLIIEEIKKQFKNFVEALDCEELNEEESLYLDITPEQIVARKMNKIVKKQKLLSIIEKNGKYDKDKNEPLIDIYDKASINSFVKDFLVVTKKKLD